MSLQRFRMAMEALDVVQNIKAADHAAGKYFALIIIKFSNVLKSLL